MARLRPKRALMGPPWGSLGTWVFPIPRGFQGVPRGSGSPGARAARGPGGSGGHPWGGRFRALFRLWPLGNIAPKHTQKGPREPPGRLPGLPPDTPDPSRGVPEGRPGERKK